MMIQNGIAAILLWILLGANSLHACRKPGANFNEGVRLPTDSVVDQPAPSLNVVRSWLTDKNATAETAALFYNLKRLAKTRIIFGHQDATKRGYGWVNEQHRPQTVTSRSDVKDLTGSYPGLYGHDFLHIANFDRSSWFLYETDLAARLTIEAYERGGINSYAWHYANPVTKGSFYWDQSPVRAVEHILPGASYHEVYKSSLKQIAEFVKALKGKDGKLVPIIFRPFHEFDGDWFWWGKAHCTAAEYKSLYKFTVTYLRDSLSVRNLLYAWSPDRNFSTETMLMERYPGDDYVDLIGMDNYFDLRMGADTKPAADKLKILSDYANRKNKIAALTETGLDRIPQADWFTASLLKALTTHKPQLSYVMVWANTSEHFWTPYPGHPAEEDFKKFISNPLILMEDKLPAMYKLE